MSNITSDGRRGEDAALSHNAQEKYATLSAKYGNDFYGYIGYVLTERGQAGWLKLVESVPPETLEAAVDTWIKAGRPAATAKPGHTGASAAW
jgi:hypothetical protein